LSLSTLVKEAQEEQDRIVADGSSAMEQANDVSKNFFESLYAPKNGVVAPNIAEGVAVPQQLTLAAASPLSSQSQIDTVGPPSQEQSSKRRKRTHRVYAARTIAGLIAALAEEALDLHVEVHTQHHTPLWRKTIDTIQISFSKLGFKPLRMRGVEILSQTMKEWEDGLNWKEKREYTKNLQMEMDMSSNRFSVGNMFDFTGDMPANGASGDRSEAQIKPVVTAEEAFRQMDTDNSGALDQGELVAALNMAISDHQEIGGIESSQFLDATARSYAATSPSSSALPVLSSTTGARLPSWSPTRTEAILERLAARLVQLYDVNGDGVVDRSEYLTMVEDMAALRRSKRRRHLMQLQRKNRRRDFRKMLASWLWNLITKKSNGDETTANGSGHTGETNGDGMLEVLEVDDVPLANQTAEELEAKRNEIIEHTMPVKIPSRDPMLVGSQTGEGTIVIENLKLDLRRLVFGAVPVVKHVRKTQRFRTLCVVVSCWKCCLFHFHSPYKYELHVAQISYVSSFLAAL